MDIRQATVDEAKECVALATKWISSPQNIDRWPAPSISPTTYSATVKYAIAEYIANQKGLSLYG